MKAIFRILVACALAVALPLQGAAFAMAKVGSSHERAPMLAAGHSHAHADGGGHDHAMPVDPCDEDPNAGILKCCHTPAVWLDGSIRVAALASSSIERRRFVPRWTSFIPEEPSPPPISGLLVA